MNSKQIIAIMIVFLSQLGATAQKKSQGHSKEISFTTDNDNYLLQKRDGYYTNGFYFSFQHLGAPAKQADGKLILRYEIGQMIFNPYKYSVIFPTEMDRPFAGYLYAKFSRSKFYRNSSNLQYGISAGVLGNASGAKATQRRYHDLINIYDVEGWTYQLKNEIGVNLSGQYSYPLSGKLRESGAVDVNGIVKASLGNTFTNGVAGILFRVGRLADPSRSVAWNSRISKQGSEPVDRTEFFVFFQPEVMYQVYNATLQGGLFRDDPGPVTAPLEPWVYQHRVGLMFAAHRYSAVLAVVHRTREASSMRRKENYGSVMFGYRFN